MKAIFAFSVIASLAVGLAQSAYSLMVDGEPVDESRIDPLAIGNTFTGALEAGDDTLYENLSSGFGGYYEDIRGPVSYAEATSVVFRAIADKGGEAWVDVFEQDPATGDYWWLNSDSAWDASDFDAELSGTLEAGKKYLFGVSSISELAAFKYSGSFAAGTNTEPIGGTFKDGCGGCDAETGICYVCLYETLTADGGGMSYQVSSHSSDRANKVVGTMKAIKSLFPVPRRKMGHILRDLLRK